MKRVEQKLPSFEFPVTKTKVYPVLFVCFFLREIVAIVVNMKSRIL